MVDKTSPQKLAKVLLDFGLAPGNFPVRLGEPRELYTQLNTVALWALGRIPEQLAEHEILLTDAARLFVRRACFAPDNTHYQVMGLTPNAFAPEVLRTRYRALIRLTHPDRGVPGLPGNAAGTVNRAHEVLSDPSLRSRYDEQLADRPVPAPVVHQGAKFRRIEHEYGFADKWHSLKARYPKLVRLALSTGGVSAVAVGLFMWAAHDAQEGRMLVIAGSEPPQRAEQNSRPTTGKMAPVQVVERSQPREPKVEIPRAVDTSANRALAIAQDATAKAAKATPPAAPEPTTPRTVAAAPSPAQAPAKVEVKSPLPAPPVVVAEQKPTAPAAAVTREPTREPTRQPAQPAQVDRVAGKSPGTGDQAATGLPFSVDASARIAVARTELPEAQKQQLSAAAQTAAAPPLPAPMPMPMPMPAPASSPASLPAATSRTAQPTQAFTATQPQAPTRIAAAANPPPAGASPASSPAAGIAPAWDVDSARAKHYLIELISTLSSKSATQATNTYLAGMNVKGSLLRPALTLMQQYPDVSIEKMSWTDSEQAGVLQVRGEIVLLARSPQEVPRTVAYRLSAEFWGTKTGTVLATLSLRERE